MMDQQQQQPPFPPSSSINDKPTENAVAVSASDVVESSTSSPVDAASSPNIFHVLLLPGGNVQKDSDKANKNAPNVIIDDYLYQRHVYRKQAEARRLRPAVGGAVKITDVQNNNDQTSSLNELASPLEIALASCCIRPTPTENSLSSIESPSSSSTTQRSRLHRPILPSNYFLTVEEEESDEYETQPLDTPRTISMKNPHHASNASNNSNSSSATNKQVGTLRKGQEAHFLKLLQMYCPQCKEGVMYRSLVVEILQRTADWESGANDGKNNGGCADMSTASSNGNNSGKKVGLGQVGYTFRKQFHSGWYIGRVTEIIPTNNIRGAPAATTASTAVKDRRCVYNDGDEEDLSLEELKRLAKLEELDRYHHDQEQDNDDDEQRIKTGSEGGDGNNGCSSGGGSDSTKELAEEEGGKKDESAEGATEVQVATSPSSSPPPPPPPGDSPANNKKNKHTVMKTFLAVGGMKLLARWLVEAYTVVQPTSTTQSNKRKSSSSQKAATEAAIVSPSPTGALLLPLLTLLKSIPFDKEIIVASSIHKYIKRYKKALDKLSKGMDSHSLNEVAHPLAGGGSVGKAMKGVEEVMTSWNNATAASAAKAEHDNDGGNNEQQHQQLDPYKDVRDQLQSRFDELAAFHNNRTNPPEWVPKHVLGVVMASPKAAPASPTGSSSSKPNLNNTTSSSSTKSNHHPPTKTSSNEWGTNRASAAQLARERFLEGFRRQKDAVSSTISGPPEKMQKVAHGNDRLPSSSSSSSKKVCWVDQPIGRKGASPQPLVTERVFVKEEEYVAEEEEAEMFDGEDDGNVEDVPMQEQGDDVVCDYQGNAMMEGEAVKDDQEDSDLDDMF